MKLFTGLFRAARKRTMTTDNDMGQFRAKLEELVAGKDGLKEEEVVAKVDELKGLTADLPESEDKAKLDRFLDDFKAVKEQDEATAKEAASMVADLFEKLDTAAMQDVPAVEPAAEGAEEPQAETTEPADAEPVAEETEEIAEETEIPAEEGEPKDADAPLDEYTAEELYQFTKKRLIEEFGLTPLTDAACKDEEPKEVQEEKEKEEEEVVTDHAPFIPVTMNQQPAAEHGSLRDLLNKF